MSLRQSQAWWIIWAWISGSFSLYSHAMSCLAGTCWNGWSSTCLDVHLWWPALRMPLRPRWVPKTIPIWAESECQVRRSQDAKVLGKLLRCINDASMANGCQWLFVFRGVPYWFWLLSLSTCWLSSQNIVLECSGSVLTPTDGLLTKRWLRCTHESNSAMSASESRLDCTRLCMSEW